MNDLSHCSASESFALRVIGDDMAPEFNEGQVIIVDPGGKVSSGCFVVAKLGDEMIFRQLWISEGRYRLRVISGNKPEIELEQGLADIVGVISQRAGRRRAEHKRYDV